MLAMLLEAMNDLLSIILVSVKNTRYLSVLLRVVRYLFRFDSITKESSEQRDLLLKCLFDGERKGGGGSSVHLEEGQQLENLLATCELWIKSFAIFIHIHLLL